AEAPERPRVVDEVTRILAAGSKAAAEQMNDSHPFRSHALRRMIDVEQEIHVAALAEDNVGIHAQVAVVLIRSLRREGGKIRQRWSRHECAGSFNKTASVDLLHPLISSRYSLSSGKDNTPESG